MPMNVPINMKGHRHEFKGGMHNNMHNHGNVVYSKEK